MFVALWLLFFASSICTVTLIAATIAGAESDKRKDK